MKRGSNVANTIEDFISINNFYNKVFSEFLIEFCLKKFVEVKFFLILMREVNERMKKDQRNP